MFVKSIKQSSLFFLFFSLCLVIFPHIRHVALWAIIVFVVLGSWRIIAHVKPALLPHRWILLIITVILVAAHVFDYGTLFGRDVGVSLLIVMAGLKLMETRTKRDGYMAIYLGLFLVVTNFLFSQTIGLAAYLFIAVLLLTACMVDLSSQTQSPTIAKQLKVSTILLLQALPMSLVLFVLFPRIPGPLWVLPKDAQNAKSGLSEEMSPGQISRLIQNPEVAFRATFSSAIPPPEQRYWRGIVLSHYDGKTWRQGQSKVKDTSSNRAIALKQPVSYRINLEPHNKKWLFGLDLPALDNQYGETLTNYSIRHPKDIVELFQYKVTSYLEYNTGDLAHPDYHQTTQLPDSISKKVIRTAKDWYQDSPSKNAYIQKVLTYFNQENFSYTLQPPLLGDQPVEDFLFNTRKGFCEHYSSTFTLLMRAVGIPARVVTGYQGGDFNEIGEYMIIRQSDAHAWSEVWLPDRGWLRIDPTAAVAPERIDQTIDIGSQLADGSIVFESKQLSAFAQSLKQLAYRWDAVNHAWNDWFIGYDTNLQKDFLNRLGLNIHDWKDLMYYLFFTFTFVFAVVFYFLLNKSAKKTTDPILFTYQQFCRKLAKLKLIKQENEGPEDFRSRVCKRYPSLQPHVDDITALYIQLRYGQSQDNEAFSTFKSKVRQFSPEQVRRKYD